VTAQIPALLEHLEKTGALSVPASDLASVAEQFAEPSNLSVSDDLRQIVNSHHLNRSPVGELLSGLAHLLDRPEPGGQPQH
jgi:hypothetical protein